MLPEKACEWNKPLTACTRQWQKQCLALLKKMSTQKKLSWPFNEPVDPVGVHSSIFHFLHWNSLLSHSSFGAARRERWCSLRLYIPRHAHGLSHTRHAWFHHSALTVVVGGFTSEDEMVRRRRRRLLN